MTCYINSVGCISAQKTFDNATFLEDIIIQNANVLPIASPVYKNYIDRTASRRMSKGIKMGVVASTIALQEAGVTSVDAILTGTGLGCMRDSEKFLENILDNDEEFLTPTAFIQSTHNTVGAQIALGLKCPAYNLTYVHGAASFESTLIDALLMFGEEEAQNILVGGIEELGDHTVQLFQLIHHLKKEQPPTLDLLNTQTKGAVFGEGAQFFVLSQQQQESTYCQLKDVEIIGQLAVEQLNNRLTRFLKKNNLAVKDIDLAILGNNGDIEFDHFYHQLQQEFFGNTPQIYYKHLAGEYNTVSAFGCWIAAKVLKTQHIPDVLWLNTKHTEKRSYQHVLLYNQYRGENHSFILMERL